MLAALFLVAAVASTPSFAVAQLAAGQRAFRAGDYAQAARVLDGLGARLPLNRDIVLYFSGESFFYTGALAQARAAFAALAQLKGSRFASVAGWRAADCQWAAGDRRAAGAAYRALLKKKAVPDDVDVGVARFHLAELADGAEAHRLFWAIHMELPAHPLADEAARRARALGQASVSGPTDAATADSPKDRLKRAAILAEGRQYQEAHDELDKLAAADLPADLAAERDFELGRVKYRMRRDYPLAARLLLGAVSRLKGESAAWAAFHGARALSRADQDDAAIAGYHQVVEQFPRSKWAAEAQFLSGWLDFNRGRYRESLPGLRATLARFPRSPFVDDAAWYLAFAHFLLNETTDAAEALARYARLVGGGSGDSDAAKRVLYWRARIAAKAGRTDEALTLLRACAQRWPLSHYGLLARARLQAAGADPGISLVARDGAPDFIKAALVRDPAVARADELAAAGLTDEAGAELGRQESGLFKRHGADQTLALLFDRYPRMNGFHRAYQLAEVRGAPALAAAPQGAARIVWEAAYPRAYHELVDAYGPPAGNPDLFLYAIMRKESGYSPGEVSYADARGLLQMIPTTARQIAADSGQEFFGDQLYEPEVNVRLGATYIGSLYKKFREQVPLAAGSYNAGAGAMMRWCDRHGQHPMDEFVELIAFEQTREYVKRVVGIYAHYRYLYTAIPYELPLVVDPRYLRQEN